MLEKLGVQLVRLDLPFRLNHVNCFLAEGASGWTVIDTGLNNSYTRNVWEEQIRNKEVKDIFITHYHPDHYGYAGGMQQKTGACVTMSEIDADVGRRAWTEPYIAKIRKGYDKATVPAGLADQMTTNNEEFELATTPHPNVAQFFQEGEKVVIGKEAYEVIFTPDHADGLVCFYQKEKDVLFSTDHILPKITPNISYWFHGDVNPLQSYFASLEKIKKLDVGYVIPSHGKQFSDANKRIDEIISHHEDRLTETFQYIKETTTVYDVCKRLFPKDLTTHEMRFAIGETLAHVEYLRLAGDCVRETKDGRWYYRMS